MGKNKYYSKIDGTIYNLKKVQELIINQKDWDSINEIVKIVGCDYGIAGNIFMQIKENNNEIPTIIDSSQQPQSKTQQYQPKCPTCGSPRIKKISGISKAGSVAMFGILSRKVHKQWHCDNCGSEW